jgi:hypothetical protein
LSKDIHTLTITIKVNKREVKSKKTTTHCLAPEISPLGRSIYILLFVFFLLPCYTPSIMTTHPITIDISTLPELAELVEEIAATKTPRILQRDHETIAVVMPVASILAQPEDIWHHYDAKRVQIALKKSAGALAGVNRKHLLTDIAQERSQETIGCSS